MANFTLARRDSYLEYLHAGVKQDTLAALRTAPVYLNSLFPDQLITKAEEEICRSEERLRIPSHVNDNQCVNCVTRLKDSVYVSGQIGLNPSPVIAGDKKVTLDSHVDFFVANAHSVTGLPQKKGVNPNYCYKYTEIKDVKDVSCVGHLSSANTVTNVPTVVMNPPVGTRLHNFWEKWEVLG